LALLSSRLELVAEVLVDIDGALVASETTSLLVEEDEEEEGRATELPNKGTELSEILFSHGGIVATEEVVCSPNNEEVESVLVASTVLIVVVTFDVIISDVTTISLRAGADDVIVCDMGKVDAVDNTVFSPNRFDVVPACPNRLCFAIAGLMLAVVLEIDEKDCPPNNDDANVVELGATTGLSATVALVLEAGSSGIPKSMLLVVFGSVMVDVSGMSFTCDDPDAKEESCPATIG